MFRDIFISISLTLILINVCYMETIPIEMCEGTDQQCSITNPSIEPCREAPKACRIRRGQLATMSFNFVPQFNGDNIVAELFWVSGDRPDAPLITMNKTACAFSTCPYVAGEANSYRYGLVTSRSDPISLYNIKWKLSNSEGQTCCFTTHIRVVR